jgi:hypothetical protein
MLTRRNLRRLFSSLVFALPLVGLAACQGSAASKDSNSAPLATATSAAPSPAVEPLETDSEQLEGEEQTDVSGSRDSTAVDPDAELICDPGQGFPRYQEGCPDADPKTGWLTVDPTGGWLVEPFRTYLNDAEGAAYAEANGLDYPFDNDHRDISTGPAQGIQIEPKTLCTGIISVGYQDPLLDHPVACRAFDRALRKGIAIPVVWWAEGGRVVQFSELFRP